MTKKNHKKLTITQVRSGAGCLPSHRATLLGLGLRKMHQTVVLEDTPCVRGMVAKISYLLQVEHNT